MYILGTESSNPDYAERMLIRVNLPNKEGNSIIIHTCNIIITYISEGLFNADCNVALLLDTIKKRHQIARQGFIVCRQLCNTDIMIICVLYIPPN